MIAWLVEALVGSALLMAGVLAVRRAATRAFGPRIAYALWALPAARLILPPLPGHHPLFRPVLRLAPIDGGPAIVGFAPTDSALVPVALPPGITEGAMARTVDWPLLLGMAWAAGAALFFAWQLVRYRSFVRRALRGAVLLAVEAGIEVWACPAVASPMASGLLRRRILLPGDFLTRFSSGERRQALLHEGAHHDRRDILANLGALAVLAAHWWNPLAHLAYRAFRADQELACDATVLDGAGAEDRYAYGSALVKAGGGARSTAACALDNGIEIRRRLRTMARAPLAAPRRAAGALAAIGAIGGGLIATASGSHALSADAPALSVAPVSAPASSPAPLLTVEPEARPMQRPAAPARPHSPAPPIVVRVSPSRPTPAQPRRSSELDDAEREAAEASRAAVLAGQAAREAGERAAAAGRRAAQLANRWPLMDGPDAAAGAAITRTRAAMARHCAEIGTPVGADEADWHRLATCNGRIVVTALEAARADIARASGLSEAQRADATASIDRALSRARTGVAR